jgi:hypothetical protein
MENWPGILPPATASGKDTIYPQKTKLICTRNQTMTKAPWKFVQVDIMQVKVYLKPTELYTQ